MKKNQTLTIQSPTARTATRKPLQKSNARSAADQNKKKLLEQIKGLTEKPITLEGFDEHILGYDLETEQIIYDGYGIINTLVDDAMEEDCKNDRLDGEWEDYYDRALEYVCNGLPQKGK